ncbi:hypothetical protein JXB12_11845 [candidate division KSB1 bacterium]|nr:hypothetical protein [candidate division KSB1 bacterium]
MEEITPNIRIVVNDKKLPLNRFVKEITVNIILALITSLKSNEKPNTIKIELDFGEQS